MEDSETEICVWEPVGLLSSCNSRFPCVEEWRALKYSQTRADSLVQQYYTLSWHLDNQSVFVVCFLFCCFSGRRKGLQCSGLLGKATHQAYSHTIDSHKLPSTAGPEGRLYQLFGWGLYLFIYLRKGFIFTCVYVCVSVQVCTYKRSIQGDQKRELFPGAAVACDCEPCDVGAGNWILVP